MNRPGEKLSADVRQRVLSRIDDDELIALAGDLARFQSFSGQEKACAEWLGAYLDRHGFAVELPEPEPNRPNVVARLRGDGSGASLMFNGHLDVDPLSQDYKHDPWRIEVRDGRLWGHGLANMKAGVASMCHAAVAIKRAGIPLKGDLVVAGVVGELQAGIGTRHLIETGRLTDLGLVPEPSDMVVRTMHSGVFTVLIAVRGQSGWIGGMHRYRTVNAVDKMADVVRALREIRFTHTPNPDLPHLPKHLIGTIVGGLGDELLLWRGSYVPDTCMITFEVRMTPQMSVAGVLADIERVLQRCRAADPDLSVQALPPPAAYREPWRANPLVMPALDLPRDHPLALSVTRHYRELIGAEPKVGSEDPGSYAGTDAGHLSGAGVKCLVFGPTGNTWAESWVELKKLHAHTRIYALCAAEILTTERRQWVDN
jgi:acetylornithine deacetylase